MTVKPATWNVEAMKKLGMRHAQLEAEGDLDAVMATIVEDPVYEFWPIGLRMRGRAAVRRYYEHLIGTFYGEQKSYRLIEEWVSERSLAQEYEMVVEFETGPEAHHVIGILFAEELGTSGAQGGGGRATQKSIDEVLLGGERIWGSKAILQKMVGPIWQELEAIED